LATESCKGTRSEERPYTQFGSSATRENLVFNGERPESGEDRERRGKFFFHVERGGKRTGNRGPPNFDSHEKRKEATGPALRNSVYKENAYCVGGRKKKKGCSELDSTAAVEEKRQVLPRLKGGLEGSG